MSTSKTILTVKEATLSMGFRMKENESLSMLATREYIWYYGDNNDGVTATAHDTYACI